MLNPLIAAYQNQQLPHAVLLLIEPAQANEVVNDFIASLQLNPADYLLFPESTALKIADARAIRRFADMSRFTSPIKLVFIADANQLTGEAANALLKTLEEPPAHTHIILASNRPDNLLPTVRSRCQTIQMVADPAAASDIPKLEKLRLSQYLELAKNLAASDTPLPVYLQAWLQQTQERRWQSIILDYLPAAQTPVNRRLLLDNLFLDLYNTD